MDGIQIGELLPLLAKQADKYSHHPQHDARQQRPRDGGLHGADRARRAAARSIRASGAVVSLFKGYDAGYKGLIPPYIVLTEPQGRFSEAGFLGIALQAVRHRRRSRRRPASPSKASSPRASPTSGSRTAASCCTSSTRWQHALPRRPAAGQPREDAEKQAYDLILGDAGKVFDLSQEKDDLRDRYGRNTFGQSCLVARRLVERGVPYVTINYQAAGTRTSRTSRPCAASCRSWTRAWRRCCRILPDRGLLDSTIVWWGGEFGRTPKVQWEAPWNGGRGHYWGRSSPPWWPAADSRAARSSARRTRRAKRSRTGRSIPCDLIGSMYELLGIDTAAKLPHPLGIPAR